MSRDYGFEPIKLSDLADDSKYSSGATTKKGATVRLEVSYPNFEKKKIARLIEVIDKFETIIEAAERLDDFQVSKTAAWKCLQLCSIWRLPLPKHTRMVINTIINNVETNVSSDWNAAWGSIKHYRGEEKSRIYFEIICNSFMLRKHGKNRTLGEDFFADLSEICGLKTPRTARDYFEKIGLSMTLIDQTRSDMELLKKLDWPACALGMRNNSPSGSESSA